MTQATMERAARTTDSGWALMGRAAGSPGEMLAKFGRFGKALAAYGDGDELEARMGRLKELGYMDSTPNRVQLIIGSADMLRFWIAPASADYYEMQGINFAFHQVLRFLDEPASLIDPTGFLSTEDNIIGHVMQVVHANPLYDLQLLEAHEGGVEELARQVEQMLDGTHPRAASIGAIVEEPDYHERLLEYVRSYLENRETAPIKRVNVDAGTRWEPIERTFGSLPAAMRYFCRMPEDPSSGLRHLLTVKEFPLELAETDA